MKNNSRRLGRIEELLRIEPRKCRKYAEEMSALDEEPWTEDRIVSYARELAVKGGIFTHEEALRHLDGDKKDGR